MSDDEFQLKLEEDGEDEKKEQEFVITRSKAIGLVVFVIVLIIFFAVISGVFSARRARIEALDENQSSKGGKAPGKRPAPTEEPGVTAGTEVSTSTAAPTNASTNASGPISNATAVTPSQPVKPWKNIRLPQNIRPVHYSVYLDPYLELNTFKGNVSVLINVTEKSDVTSYILIHINDMNVTHAKVYKRDSNVTSNTTSLGEEIPSKTFEYSENDYFVFELEKDLEVGGQYVLLMSYKSTFSSQLNGLYISTYTNEKGEQRWVVLCDR